MSEPSSSDEDSQRARPFLPVKPAPRMVAPHQLRVSVPLSTAAPFQLVGALSTSMVAHLLMAVLPASAEMGDPAVLVELPSKGVGTLCCLMGWVQEGRIILSHSFLSCRFLVAMRSSASPGVVAMLTDDLECMRSRLHSL